MVQNKKILRRSSAPASKRTFGPVTAISTAPVALGNSIRGSKPLVDYTNDGCRVRGRDFGFEVGSSVAAATGWTLVGGIPLTPCAMPATSLKAYCQMFGFFKINSITAHYITSSPTSQAGDVMFYLEKDRAGPMVDWSSSSFLPYVLSDSHTVLGPQWTNHSAAFRPNQEFKSLDYGTNLDLTEEAAGSIFIFSKTNAANSPGYIIFDYDITFKEHQSNPRAGLLPVVRAQWLQTCIGETGVAQTIGVTELLPAFQGKTIAGVNAAAPSGSGGTDIYKVIFDVTNSTVSGVNAAWTNVTPSTVLVFPYNATYNVTTVDDGFTCYAVVATTTMKLHATYADAVAGTHALRSGATSTNTYNISCYFSLVGGITRLQNSY